MIDFHSHILPGIDDGSRNIEETRQLLNEAAEAGFEVVISTSHYIEGYYEAGVQERKNLVDKIDVAKNTLPYTRFIMTKDCLIVLNDSNFRDDPKNVAFKYGGKIEIIGYVTNIISENNELIENDNAFSEMYKFVNQVLLKLYINKEKIYVIHPLAMYY